MATRTSGWARYQIRRRALEPACGGQLGDVQPDGVALARAAQDQWWLGLLGRLDAALDDDLEGMAPPARQAAVRRAWAAQNLAMPEYLAVAELGAQDAGFQADRRRYARLLALFAGRAGIDEGHGEAAAAGLHLVAELVDAEAGAESNLVNCFARG